jgi:hypothetical protein
MNASSMGLLFLPFFAVLQPRATVLEAQVASNRQASSLCRDEEQVIFSCAVNPGERIVSLCASSVVDHRRGYLQYRYGKPGAVDMQFPQARANTQRAFRYAHYFRAQVDRTEVSFDNHGYRYTIFHYYEGDVTPATTDAGVRVSKHGATEPQTELQCHGNIQKTLGRLDSVIPRDHDNPLNQ